MKEEKIRSKIFSEDFKTRLIRIYYLWALEDAVNAWRPRHRYKIQVHIFILLSELRIYILKIKLFYFYDG